jgi:single-stranded-DNA-specific exonuclease
MHAPPIPSGLLSLQRRWVFPADLDQAGVARLSRELRLPEPLCRLLVRRGFGDPGAAREYLRPHAGQIHTHELAGLADAVARLRRAIEGGEVILVHGDYDVDGICTTALYVRALRKMGARAEPFVPHRLTDGYDLTDAGLLAAQAVGAGVILTGDCGIVAHEAVERAARAGVDVIVTDHHTPAETLPRAVAVVNPNRRDCGYPNKGLAGVGVAYKLVVALAEELGYPRERLASYLDLVAVATIADLAPLTGENRALVRWGLKVLVDTPNPGLRALLGSTGLAGKREIGAGQVGFILAPRINAVGRMGEASRGVRLLLTDDPREAEAIAAELEVENRARQETDTRTLREALALLERSYDPGRDRGIVLAERGWHPGVIGIVASRIVERIHRPTVMIALDDGGEGKGSARSVPGFHLYDAIHACGEHLIRFGGHRAAAGCSIRAERVDAFRADFDAYARSRLSDDLLVPEIRIDLELALHEANGELLRLLRHAAPFGQGNATPVVGVRRVRVVDGPRIIGSNHLKMQLGKEEVRLTAVGWGMGDRIRELSVPGQELDVAFKLEEDSWRRRGEPPADPAFPRVQARLVDFRPSDACA